MDYYKLLWGKSRENTAETKNLTSDKSPMKQLPHEIIE